MFGYPLNTGVLYGLFWLVCIAVCILRLQIISIRCMKRSCFYCPALPAVKIQAAIHLYFCTNAIRHLFRESVTYLIAAALFVVWWNPAEKLSYDSVDEVYYKEYMDKYYGPLTAKTNELLDEERAKYDRLSDNIAYDMAQGKSESYINIKYKDELSRQEAFNKLTAHVDYLKTLNEGWLFLKRAMIFLPTEQTSKTVIQHRRLCMLFS